MDRAVQAWRHLLHRVPETGFEEVATGDAVADILLGLGLQPTRGIGVTGMVASVRRGTGERAIGLRADMDGLPISEETGLPFASRHPERMHACGHDGHMAMLLGAAERLLAEGGFDGTVHLVFQPAEEHGKGAKAMLADGLLERFPMEAMFALHNQPGLPAGHLHTRPGPIMGSEDNFEIRVHGRGGHAARPQMVVDPIVVAAEIVLALQTVVSRNVDPSHSAVLSCTEIRTDGARNAIPGEVIITGDTRSFDDDVRALLEDRMRALCEGIAQAHGATATLTYTYEFEPTVNDARATAAAVAAAKAVIGDAGVESDCPPATTSEDFGAFAREVPSCFAFLGNGTELGTGGGPLHSRVYQFNDDILDVGVNFYVELVRSVLPES